MWEDIKPLFVEFFNIGAKTFKFFWVGIKWLADAAVWVYRAAVLYVLVIWDLVTNQRSALAVVLVVLAIGYFIINSRQKRKAFIEIPWFQNPLVLTVILFPLTTLLLGLVVNSGPLTLYRGVPPFSEVARGLRFLGPAGHLGIPTNIWALVISFIFVVAVGLIALGKGDRRKKARPLPAGRQKEVRGRAPSARRPEDFQEAVILNEQPSWHSKKPWQKIEGGEAEQ